MLLLKSFLRFVLLIGLMVLSACNPMNEGQEGSFRGENFRPGLTRSTILATWPFDPGSNADYTYPNQSIEVMDGQARLLGSDQLDDDNASSGFAGGELLNLSWDEIHGGLRLKQAGSLNNINELEASWTPKWANLIAYWKLNEAAGTSGAGSVADSSASGLHALSPGGGVTLGSSGKLRSSALFDGSSGYMINSQVVNTSLVTLSAWVYLNAYPSGRSRVVGFTTGNNGGFYDKEIIVNGTGQVEFYVYDGAPRYTSPSAQSVPLNTWTHLAATFDGTKAYAFINGVEVGSVTASSTYTSYVTPNLLVGGKSGGHGYLAARIDEVAIWNTSLTSTEVKTLYNQQAARYSGKFTSRIMDAFRSDQNWSKLSWRTSLPFGKSLPSLSNNESAQDYPSLVGASGTIGDNNLMSGIVGLWHLDESAGTSGAGSIIDQSGNGLHGNPNNVNFGELGKLSQSASFNTSSSVINMAISSDIDLSRNKTVSIWLKASASQNPYPTLIYKRFSNLYYPTFGLQIAEDASYGVNRNKFIFLFGSGSSNYVVFSNSLYTSFINEWVHLVGSYDGANMRIYLNGKLESTLPVGDIVSNSDASVLSLGNDPLLAGTSFKGSLDEVAIWNRALHPTEIHQLYRRGANRLRFQVRTCASFDCSDDSQDLNWQGPDGTAQTYFSELNNVKPSSPSITFSDFTNPLGLARYFQYRTYFESDDEGVGCDYGAGPIWCSPELKSVLIDPIHYDSSAPAISSLQGFSYKSLSRLNETLGTSGCPGGIRYNLGIGSDSATASWYWWNGTTWSGADGTVNQTNSASEVNSHLNHFQRSNGSRVFLKAFLHSDGSTGCGLDEVQLSGLQ
jgi:trimeric autotransporter adhesin